MKKIRIEEDMFGAVELPSYVLYGINTYRTVENLSFSGKTLSRYPEYIKALARVKKAAALANLESGLLPRSIGNAIVSACDELISGNHHEHFPVDMLHGGGGIGTNMNTNEVISNLANKSLGGALGDYAPVHPIDHVNASQSTSDVCHTAIRLAITEKFPSLRQEIEAVMQTIFEKVVEFKEVTTIARTCLQDAMRVKVADKFSGYEAMLRRRFATLNEAVIPLQKINLGGTVIGSGVGAPKEYRDVIVQKLCEVTKIQLRHRDNLFDAAQNIDDLANVSTELRLLASCLIKLAKDLRLLSSGPEAGFGEIILPAVQAGSSFFPGKVNPVIPETLIQSCFQVIGNDRAVEATLEHGELDLNVFEGSAATNIFDSMTMLEKTLSSFRENCLKGLKVNEKRCENLSNTVIPLVVELKERHGYKAITQLMKETGIDGVKTYFYGGDKIDKN
ncbi:lyase family protein [Metabacillus herbersteinensis]|uniref:Lyase family protein n=1 Tax=Metabacillus herbersteinensis TaxID=283816 RepID=A0ABV6GIP7_9BACI